MAAAGDQESPTIDDGPNIKNLDKKMEEFDYPFTNIVLEGGGSKGMAYVGVLKVFEKFGIDKKIKRICGASAGAIVGALLAVNYTSSELQEFLEQDLEAILIDHKWGIFSLIPNLLNGYGWNPGNRLVSWFGEVLKERTGEDDITFQQVLDRYGKELCIVVTNLSQMTTEYFHPKTTPHVPIRKAVRMSMSIPGIFQTVRHKTHTTEDHYVDGGFLCNYPIHAFDGWWLSMKPEDSFFSRFRTLKDSSKMYAKNVRFGGWNDKTVGLLLYSNTETELMRERLANRPGNELPEQPKDSKLYKRRQKKRQQEEDHIKRHKVVTEAVGRFIHDLAQIEADRDGKISLDELKTAFEMEGRQFTNQDRMTLFEGSTDYETAFKMLDHDKDGQITFHELKNYVESKGVNLQQQFLGYRRKEINSFREFLVTLEYALDINVKRNYVQEKDIKRTIGIDTDYIESTDFALEMADKKFLIESGEKATYAFLRYYVQKGYRLLSE